jgi:Ca2+-binding RTX toxin-like protein
MASFIGLMMFGGLALLPTHEEPISEDPEIDDNDDVEDLAIPQSSADVMLGSFLNDMMDGSDGYDRFHGADGDDTLFGHGGDDELIGGAGNDILTGRDGSGDF